jgi:hypothetical protein
LHAQGPGEENVMRNRNQNRRLETCLAQPLAALLIAVVAAVGAIAQVGLWGDATTVAYVDEVRTTAASARDSGNADESLRAVTGRSAVPARDARQPQPVAARPRNY